MIDERILKGEEKAVFSLRALYGKYGYLPFKMSKFEEYELYIRNKNFLVSDRIITFNDASGRLLALKPDVTLSIVKNGTDVPGVKQKVYYNENVYRVSPGTQNYKEIMQTGLECIGDIDLYDIYECVSLAAQSLALISSDYKLEVSHLGVLSSVLGEISEDEGFCRDAVNCIAAKNPHDLARLCESRGVSSADAERLGVFISAYGDRKEVLSRLEAVCTGEGSRRALDELCELSSLLELAPGKDRISFDFSVVNDMSYYSGIVFKGFIDGICDGVLAGGQYDNLMHRMGRSSGAVGFALYLDLLGQIEKYDDAPDVETLLLYGDNTDKARLAEAVSSLVAQGKSVSVQRCAPPKLRYKELVDMRGEDAKC